VGLAIEKAFCVSPKHNGLDDLTKKSLVHLMTTENSKEAMLLEYIADRGLHDGQPLPSESELRGILDCTSEELKAVLTDMEKRGLVKRHDWGWTALIPLALAGKEDAFSLSRTALLHGHKLDTRVSEKALRLPLDDGPWSDFESKAQNLLGLAGDEAFIFLLRVRSLGDQPPDAPMMAIQRVYLNPRRFPDNFLEKHDFGQESLIHVYRHYGYKLLTRDTRLKPRLAYLHERNDFHLQPYEPLLHAEQETFAEIPTGEKIILEVMQATYRNWVYEIKDRPAA
jgi:DNA-binding GntR family transcriptional regulator